MIRSLRIGEPAARLRHARCAVLHECLPTLAIDRKIRPSLRFSQQRAVASDGGLRSIYVAISDVANRGLVIEPEQLALALVGKCGRLFGQNCACALVLAGFTKPPHQQLLVTAPGLGIVASLTVTDRKFGVGKRIVATAKQAARLCPPVIEIREPQALQPVRHRRISCGR